MRRTPGVCGKNIPVFHAPGNACPSQPPSSFQLFVAILVSGFQGLALSPGRALRYKVEVDLVAARVRRVRVVLVANGKRGSV